jgi:predicted ATPase
MMTHFHVKNYKCLADVSLPLTSLHVIIGQNDSGKTSLLEAMLALHRTTEGSLSDAFPGKWTGNELVFEGTDEPQVEFHAKFEDRADSRAFTYHLSVEFSLEGRSCRRTDEWYENGKSVHVRSWNNDSTGIAAACKHLGSYPALDTQQFTTVAKTIGQAQFYRLDPKVMALPVALDSGRNFRLDPDGLGLATLLDDISGFDPMESVAINEEFCHYFPQFKKYRVMTELGSSRQYNEAGLHTWGQNMGRGIYFETVHGRTIRAQQASDGAILFLGLIALMHTPSPPKLLLLEEPEKGVYPKRLAEVIGLLRNLEADSARRPVPQIVLTTHSPYLLSAFRPEEVTLLRREGDTGPVKAYPLRDAPHIEERLGEDEFYLGELWYNLTEDELLGNAQS